MNDEDSRRYAPPGSEVRDAHRPPPRGATVLGFVAGLVTDIGGSLVAGFVLAIVYAILLTSSGMSAAEVEASFHDMPLDSGFRIVSEAVGGGFSILGGYVFERIARRGDMRLGWALGLTALVIGAVLGNSAENPLHSTVLSLLSLAATLFGVRCAIRSRA